jgi:DNA repair photolyase
VRESLEHTFYNGRMADEKLFELRRRTFDTPQFKGIEFIEVEAKSIVNHVPGSYLPFNWTINPYRGCSHACVYCFARVTHTYMDMNAGRDFESKIVVKVNAPELLRKKLRSKGWKGEHIAMGTATDPYQRAEGRYKIMPRIIEALSDYRNPFSILTKGTLILRDLELLAEATEVTEVSAALSIGTLDDVAWRKSEPGTPHPRKRMEAVSRLNEAGVPCGVMVAPVLPGITDDRDKLREVVDAAVGAGATHVTPILLHLRPVVREEYMGWLQEHYPGLVESYEATYRRAYAPKSDQNALGAKVGALVAEAAPHQPARPRKGNFRRSSEKGARAPQEAEQLRLI